MTHDYQHSNNAYGVQSTNTNQSFVGSFASNMVQFSQFRQPQAPLAGNGRTTRATVQGMGIPAVAVNPNGVHRMTTAEEPSEPPPTSKSTKGRAQKRHHFETEEDEQKYRQLRDKNNQSAQKSRKNKNDRLNWQNQKIKEQEAELEASRKDARDQSKAISKLTTSNETLTMNNQTLTQTNARLQQVLAKMNEALMKSRNDVSIYKAQSEASAREIENLNMIIRQLQAEKFDLAGPIGQVQLPAGIQNPQQQQPYPTYQQPPFEAQVGPKQAMAVQMVPNDKAAQFQHDSSDDGVEDIESLNAFLAGLGDLYSPGNGNGFDIASEQHVFTATMSGN